MGASKRTTHIVRIRWEIENTSIIFHRETPTGHINYCRVGIKRRNARRTERPSKNKNEQKTTAFSDNIIQKNSSDDRFTHLTPARLVPCRKTDNKRFIFRSRF